MKSKLMLTLFTLVTLFVNAQDKPKDLTSTLVSRGTFFTGLSTNFALGFAVPEGRLILPAVFKPKVGFFIMNRLSLGLSYQGVGFSGGAAQRSRFYHNAEFELNYYFYAKKNFLFYSQTGIAIEQYSPRGYRTQYTANTNLKLGIGASWQLKKLPNLGFNVQAAYYLGPDMQTHFQKIPDVTFGLTYFFNHRKTISKKP